MDSVGDIVYTYSGTPILVKTPWIEGWDGYDMGKCISNPVLSRHGTGVVFEHSTHKFRKCEFFWIHYSGAGSITGYAFKSKGAEYAISAEEFSTYICQLGLERYQHILEVYKAYPEIPLNKNAIFICWSCLQKKKKRERAEQKMKERNDWIASLGVAIGEFCIDNDEVFDLYGNYLFRLPPEPVDDIESWLENEFKLFLGE
jgi:hypothetical protein